MSCLTAIASKLSNEISSPVYAELVRVEISISAECDCTDLTTNVLCASDGILYSSEPEPIFTTE